jgi:cytochrome c biogenesis protein CcmG, thiol:disulfide interchange protein DsbE
MVVGGLAGLAVGVGIGLFVAGGDDRDVDAELSTPGAQAGADEGIPVATDVTGELLPDARVEALDGDQQSLRDLRGTPLVLNLWFSTCPPCVREMPAFEQVHQAVGDRVRIVGLNPLDSVDAARAFADDVGVTYELFRDPGGDVTAELGVARFPTTFFVDADGRIVDTEPNELDPDELTARIEELFPA